MVVKSEVPLPDGGTAHVAECGWAGCGWLVSTYDKDTRDRLALDHLMTCNIR